MYYPCPSPRRVLSAWRLAAVLLAAVSLALTSGLRAQSTAPTATITPLNVFGSSVGITPEAAPIQGADGALYGVTSDKGPNGSGTVYRRAADGTFTVLHSFVAATDGNRPVAQLVQAPDGFFYGTTYQNGLLGGGTVFKVSADGAVFQVLHSFDPDTDGATPNAALTVGQDGVTLYGTTIASGPTLTGTIFSVSTDGTGFTVLAGVPGRVSSTALVQANANTFYGATDAGGANDGGTVFAVTLSGSEATVAVLYNFDQSTANGGGILGDLVLDNGTLFGIANGGGANNDGAIFAVKTDGSTTGSPLIYSFANGADGKSPQSGLHLLNGRLYGTTVAGGVNGTGAIFSLAEDGTGFAVTYSPSGLEESTSDLSVGTDGFLYVIAARGIATYGDLFQLSADGATLTDLHEFIIDTQDPEAPLVQGPDGSFYGATSSGGPYNEGTVFRVDPKGVLTILHNFAGTVGLVANQNAPAANASVNGDLKLVRRAATRPRVAPTDLADGQAPNGGLIFGPGGFLYGTTEDGGDTNYGTVYRIATDGTGYAVLHSFAMTTDGAYPEDALIVGTDGFLYGTAQGYGPIGEGTVFKISADGATFAVLHSFNRSVDGAFPLAGLVQGTDGFLYGVTHRGGDSNNDGTVFKVSTDGATFTTLRFLTAATDGMNPEGTLVQGPDGLFYGTAESGGASSAGTIFSISADGTAFTLVHSFVGTDGGDPQAGLLLSKDGYFYGTTVGFNMDNNLVRAGAVTVGTGTFFRFSSAADFAVLTGTTQGDTRVVTNSAASLIEGADGFLYGTSPNAGAQAAGLIYQLAVTPVVRDLSLSGKQGTALSIQVPAFHDPASFTASALPAGLTLNPVSGLITGTPTAVGTTTGTITVANALGQTTAALTFTITPPAPVITSGPLPGGQVGTAYSYQITASNGATSFGASNLPPGLTINPTTGLISGTPTTAGVFSQIMLTATNAGGTAMVNASIVIAPLAPVITSPTAVSTQAGVAFTYQIAASNNPTSFNATGLPTGLTLNALTGVISGTPTAATIYTVGLSATNAGGTGTATLTLTVTPAATTLLAPVINSPAAATATVGTAFTYQITASNGATGFGATGLPTGLTLDPASGVITGTATESGTFTVALTASNATGTGTGTLTLTVSAESVLAPVIDSITAVTTQLNEPFAYQITASNRPTSFAATGLPTGLGVNTQTGLVSGTPTQAGTFTVTLAATNANGTGTAALTLTVSTVATTTPAVTSAATASAEQGTAFTYQITATNSPTSFGATGLPTGLTVDPATGLISGTPTENGTFEVSLSATNATGTGTAALTLTVVEVTPVVTVATVGDGEAVEGGENGKVAVRRTGDLSAALTVRYKVKGDIVVGEDIKAGSVTGVVVIPAGAAQAKIKIKPIDDMAKESARVIKIKLKPATDGSYVLGAVTVAKVTLIDND